MGGGVTRIGYWGDVMERRRRGEVEMKRRESECVSRPLCPSAAEVVFRDLRLQNQRVRGSTGGRGAIRG